LGKAYEQSLREAQKPGASQRKFLFCRFLLWGFPLKHRSPHRSSTLVDNEEKKRALNLSNLSFNHVLTYFFFSRRYQDLQAHVWWLDNRRTGQCGSKYGQDS
jgi:hypothetical protein